jgi:Xaa-Pro aminopeptidase
MKQCDQVPAGEIRHRIQRCRKMMRKKGIGGLFVLQDVDLFYFLGFIPPAGGLYVPSEGNPLCFVCSDQAHGRPIPVDSPVRDGIEIQSLADLPALISDVYGGIPSTLGYELDVLPVNFFHYFLSLFPCQEHKDGSACILKVREIKSDWEVAQMENTGRLFQKVFQFAAATVDSGMTEWEFAAELEAYAGSLSPGASVRIRDMQTEGYPWHVLSGKSGGLIGLLDSPASGEGTSAAFPCGAGNKRLAPHEPIMIDFSFHLNGYHMDVTRMFCMGTMPDKAMNASESAIHIHDTVLDHVKPGIMTGELFQRAQDKADSLGYGDAYLGLPGYKVSFIGHGIGLELIENPIIAKNRNDRLEPGMTFALEPKLVFENEFIAGIESVCLVTESGCRLISGVPVKIFIC